MVHKNAGDLRVFPARAFRQGNNDNRRGNGIERRCDFTYKRFDAVKFVYTTSKDEDSHKWEFISETVEPINGVYSYTLPIDTVAFAFEVYHSDISPDCVFSTEIYLNK